MTNADANMTSPVRPGFYDVGNAVGDGAGQHCNGGFQGSGAAGGEVEFDDTMDFYTSVNQDIEDRELEAAKDKLAIDGEEVLEHTEQKIVRRPRQPTQAERDAHLPLHTHPLGTGAPLCRWRRIGVALSDRKWGHSLRRYDYQYGSRVQDC